MEKNTIENINSLEDNTLKYASEYLEDLLAYFLILQETLLTAFNNSGKLIKLKVVPNNKKLFAFIATARAFSISKVAMDITIRGYPFEGLALTRTLAELTECTDFLLRNEEFIDDYLNGKLTISQVLKKSKKEKKIEGKYNFGQIWGYMSRFAHATPDMVLLPLMPKSPNQVSIELVNNNSDQIGDVAKVITSHLLFQYFVFRIFFLNELTVVNELEKRDSELFDPINVVKLGNLFTDKESSLEEIYNFVMQSYE